ncbi:uncharacterized protein LOC143174301 [Nomia melanderi]|uniref:uncharacterized protein LOC143174301 n=1 Tax=Nomia melanderi TaxID=2448451 RepID=UPI003FCE9B08
MFTKKEKKMTYFLGGSIVGATAGFLIGKMIGNTSKVQAQTCESKTFNNTKIMNYSQDDNIHNIRLPKNVYAGHLRSKSTSESESKNCKEEPVFNNSFTTLDNSLENNMNEFSFKPKYNYTTQKVCYSDNTNFNDISIEDNVEVNTEENENSPEAINIKYVPNANKNNLLKRSECFTSTESTDKLNILFNDK